MLFRACGISITGKLYGILAIIMILVATIGVFAFYKISLLARLNSQILSSPYTIGVILRDIDAAVMSIERDLSLIPYEQDKFNRYELTSLMSENHDRLMADMNLMTKKIPEHNKLIDKARVLFKEWKQVRNAAIQAAKNGKTSQAIDLIKIKSKSYVARLDYIISQVRDIEVNKLHALSKQSLHVKESVISNIITSFFILLGIASILFVIIARSIVKPTREIAATMKKISDGNSQETIPYISRKDEVGEMARATEVFRQYSMHILDLNEELKVADRLKDEFFANMNHEMRTPLNGILGMCQVLRKGSLTEKQLRFIDTINTSGENLLNIVNDMLDLSKLEAGLDNVESIEFKIEDIIKEGLDAVRGTALLKNIELAHDISGECSGVYYGNADYIMRILINFTGNAIKFTSEGSICIKVSAESDQRLRFQVIDTGIGIPQDSIDLIFERFRQADGSDTREYGGTGLGLAICQELVDKMNGDIGVESEEGKGSVFWFEIPLSKKENDNQEAGFIQV